MLNESNYSSRAKDVLLDFLQKAFSQPDLYEGKNEYQWNPDPKQTRIFIADANTQNLETVEQKTSIIVTRGNIGWAGNTLDSFKNSESFFGSKEYKDMVQVEMSINCFSREGLEAEFLASLVFQLLRICRPAIRKQYDLHRIDVMGMGSESLVQADSRMELSTVPVFARMVWNEDWIIRGDFLQLNKIEMPFQVTETDVKEPDTFVGYPIEDILVDPSRITVTDASTNPALKPGTPVTIVGSSGGHDGSYHLGPIDGDIITLMQPLGGTEDEIGTDAEIRIVTPGGSTDGDGFTQFADSVDMTPERKRPDITE